MNQYCLTHLSDCDLLRGLSALVGQDRTTTAELVAHIAEIEARRLFVPMGFSCMYEYCVRELRLPEDAAIKRIRVARVARQFPGVFPALADGRLHLTGVFLVSRHVAAENGAELLAAAEGRSKAEILLLLAERFPQADLPARLVAVASPGAPAGLPAPEQVEGGPAASGLSDLPAPEQPTSAAPWPKVEPLSAERYALHATITRLAHDNLHYAQALLGHAVPSGDIGEVLGRALAALVVQLEKQKFAATSRPRPSARSSADPRHVPAHVKRAVCERDGGQCSFVGEGGHRCTARTRLEFDHVDPVALGGEATVDGIRLRCRAHNQYEAECVFGAGFMESKREVARQARETARQEAAEARRARAAEKERAAAEKKRAAAAEQDPGRSVVPWLLELGVRIDDARRAAVHCESIPDATLEQRVREALRFLAASRGRLSKAVRTAA